MAISTYGGLLDAIEAWLSRSDTAITASASDFVELAQNRIRTDLRTSEQETVTTISIDAEYVTLPTGVLSVRHLDIDGSPDQAVEYVTPQLMARLDDGETGKPRRFTIVNQQIQVYPVPSSTYTGNITYTAAYSSFSTSTATDYVLTSYPNVYLYGSLLEANLKIRNNEEALKYGTLYEGAVSKAQRAEDKIKYPFGLRVRKSGATP